MNRQTKPLLIYFILFLVTCGPIPSASAIVLQLADPDSDEYFRLNISGVNLEDSIADSNAFIEVGDFEYFNGVSSIFNDVAMTNRSLSQDTMGMDSSSSGFDHQRWKIEFRGNDYFRNSFGWSTLYHELAGGSEPFGDTFSRWSDLHGSAVDGHQHSWYVGGSQIYVKLNADFPNAGDSAWRVNQVPEPSFILLLLTSLAAAPLRVRCG